MKYGKLTSLLLLLMVAFALTGCKEDDNLTVGEPYKALDGINYTWVIDEVRQIDNLNTTADNWMDVTSFFAGANPLKITFNSADYTFSITPGDGPNYLGTSGMWQFDDAEYPTSITLEEGGVFSLLTLNAPVRDKVDQYLDVTFDRDNCGGETAVSYNYRFIREN